MKGKSEEYCSSAWWDIMSMCWNTLRGKKPKSIKPDAQMHNSPIPRWCRIPEKRKRGQRDGKMQTLSAQDPNTKQNMTRPVISTVVVLQSLGQKNVHKDQWQQLKSCQPNLPKTCHEQKSKDLPSFISGTVQWKRKKEKNIACRTNILAPKRQQ